MPFCFRCVKEILSEMPVNGRKLDVNDRVLMRVLEYRNVLIMCLGMAVDGHAAITDCLRFGGPSRNAPRVLRGYRVSPS